MNKEFKTKKQLISELDELYRRIAELEKKEIDGKHTKNKFGTGTKYQNPTQIDFQYLFNSIEVCLFIINLDGRIIHINPAVTRDLQYSEEELTGRNILDLHPSEKRETAAINYRNILAGKKKYLLIPIIAKNGSQISFQTQIIRGYLNEKKVFLGISQIITDRQKMELEIIEKEDKYSESFCSGSTHVSISR